MVPKESPTKYLPVFGREVNESLKIKDGQIFIDMTFGNGGHSRNLLNSGKDIKVIAVDRDPKAYEMAIQLARETNFQVIPILAKWSEMPNKLKNIGLDHGQINGIIIDAGTSTIQDEDDSRGFRHDSDCPLDMRMDGDRQNGCFATAADVLNTLDSHELTKIFRLYGEEKLGKKVASAVVDARFMMMPMKTTTQLRELIMGLMEEHGGGNALAIKIFRSLRMFVNNELNELNYAIDKMRNYLVFDPKVADLNRHEVRRAKDEGDFKSGVMAVITSTPIEDKVVKDHFMMPLVDDANPYYQRFINQTEETNDKDMSKILEKMWLPLDRFVRFADEDEVLSNPRSRGCKLRVAMRAK